MNARPASRPGLGPVFACEWVALSRRRPWYLARSAFAALLLLALLLILARSDVPFDRMTFRDLARLGGSFYIAAIGTQLTLVLLAAPAATAGAICQDRASGRLTALLVTDLSDAEIVLGKLASRLVPVLGLVACALPLLAILTLLGGVDPAALAGGFAVTVGVALLGCTLAFALSLWAKTTHEALLGTYAVWGLWLMGRPFVALVNQAYGTSLALPARVADPYFLAFSPYWSPNAASAVDYAWFLAITAGISAALAAVAVARLRAVCTRHDVPRKKAKAGLLERLGSRLRLDRLPGPPLDFNPVLWREWHRARPSRGTRVALGLFAAGAVVASVGSILVPRSTFSMAWVNGFQVAIGMLLLSVMASTSLSEERVRGSLDVLMATPLSTRAIVLGKWLGTARLVPWLAVLPVVVVLANDPRDWLYLPTALLTGQFVFACGAAITGLGLAMATWCPRLGRAVALTVSCYVLVAVGWLFVAMWLGQGGQMDGAMMASPFFFAGELAADLCSGGNGRGHIGWAVFWTTAYGLAAVGLVALTLASFNRCLGRVEFGARRAARPSPRAARPSTGPAPALPVDPRPARAGGP